MVQISREERARREGMSYALRVAQTRGIKGLEDEIRKRNAIGIPIGCTKRDIEKIKKDARDQAVGCVLTLALSTLRDEFEFGRGRMERFVKRFWNKAECIDGDYVSWREILESLKEECGIEIEIKGLGDEDL